jgi:hypothetical protein
MLVTPTGDRLWRFRYRHRGVEKLLAKASQQVLPGANNFR